MLTTIGTSVYDDFEGTPTTKGIHHRVYTVTTTKYPRDYDTVRRALAEMGYRVLVRSGGNTFTFDTIGQYRLMTVTMVLRGLLDGLFIDGVDYIDRRTNPSEEVSNTIKRRER